MVRLTLGADELAQQPVLWKEQFLRGLCGQAIFSNLRRAPCLSTGRCACPKTPGDQECEDDAEVDKPGLKLKWVVVVYSSDASSIASFGMPFRHCHGLDMILSGVSAAGAV